MAMQSLPLKWRPRRFVDLVGNAFITQILKQAVRSGKINTAYFLSGGKGSGKTTSARIFAKAINCLQHVDGEPCNECPSCVAFDNDASFDIVEIDAASENSVQSIRELNNSLQYPPLHSKYKVVILDECHMLQKSAGNTLLKTLEEPPDHVKFIFCTTDPQMVLDTILSRTMRFAFKRLQSKEIVDRLILICDTEGFEYEIEALNLISFSVNGGMRDAITYLDQLAIATGKVTAADCANLVGFVSFPALVELFSSLKDTTKSIGWARTKLSTNSPTEIINSILRFVENLIYIQNGVVLSDISKDMHDNIKLLSSSIDYRNLVDFVQACNKTLLDIKRLNVFDHSIFIFSLLLQFKAILEGKSQTVSSFSLAEAFKGVNPNIPQESQLDIIKKYFSFDILLGTPNLIEPTK